SRGNARTLLEEVLVVARKKSDAESVQSVPITITALNGDQIEAAFAETIKDIGRLIPNVQLDTIAAFPGTANYAIRGMGFISSIGSTDPTVGLFVDGMYLGINAGSNLDVFDLESVEVLRGPQGT